jgi:hypothetical protein
VPDYRVTLSIGALRPGVAPDTVLPTASAAASELTMVEASDLAIVAGEARIRVRFEAEDGELATQIADHVAAVTQTVAEVARYSVTERVKGRWFSVR